jgi:hypothetical protein|tara:strand:- start:56 stop:520 length:465 start_codon:yes stop_codon:yes gene_type:complete
MSQRSINILDRIGTLIPGYSGYADRDSRKNCDKKLRIFLSDKLRGFENLISESIADCAKSSDLIEMNKLESIRKKINTLSSKILYAPYGSNAFFSDQKINTTELDQIYDYDINISDEIDKLLLLDCFSNNETSNTISNLTTLLNNRNNFIKNFK